MHYNYGKNIGLVCVSSLFLVNLYHTGEIENCRFKLQGNPNQPQGLDELDKLAEEHSKEWLKLSKIRPQIKQFLARKDFFNFFDKIIMLLSIRPSTGHSRKHLKTQVSLEIELEAESEVSELGRVKEYLKRIKEENQKGGPENPKDNLFCISDEIVSLSNPQIDPEIIFNTIRARLTAFEEHKECLQLFVKMTKNSKESILVPEIVSSFENLFRK